MSVFCGYIRFFTQTTYRIQIKHSQKKKTILILQEQERELIDTKIKVNNHEILLKQKDEELNRLYYRITDHQFQHQKVICFLFFF